MRTAAAATFLAALALASPRAFADAGRASQLVKQVASNPGDFNAMKDLELECLKVAKPGAERERATVCVLIVSKLGPSTALESRVCLLRQLENIGGGEVVVPLSRLLKDREKRVREGARRALISNPSAQATKALTLALGKAKGDDEWRAALVTALGRRADESAVEKLVPLLRDDCEPVAIAAVHALGTIGGSEAARALSGALSKGSQAQRAAAVDAYLNCADRYLAEGYLSEASKIYRKLFTSSRSKLLKIAAMQGLTAVKKAKESGVKDRRLASRPSSRFSSRASSRMATRASAAAGKPEVDAKVVAAWDARLQKKAKAAVAGGSKPSFFLESMRTKVKLVSVQDGGRLKVSARGMQLGVSLSRMKLTDKKNVAEAVAGTDPEAHAVAAFYCMALGKNAEAGAHLRRAGTFEAEVRKAFE